MNKDRFDRIYESIEESPEPGSIHIKVINLDVRFEYEAHGENTQVFVEKIPLPPILGCVALGDWLGSLRQSEYDKKKRPFDEMEATGEDKLLQNAIIEKVESVGFTAKYRSYGYIISALLFACKIRSEQNTARLYITDVYSRVAKKFGVDKTTVTLSVATGIHRYFLKGTPSQKEQIERYCGKEPNIRMFILKAVEELTGLPTT